MVVCEGFPYLEVLGYGSSSYNLTAWVLMSGGDGVTPESYKKTIECMVKLRGNYNDVKKYMIQCSDENRIVFLYTQQC